METVATRNCREQELRVLDAQGLRVACCLWCVAFSVMITLVLRGTVEGVPYHVYLSAGARWLTKSALYETETIDGFQYLPTAAWIFSAFARLGMPVGTCAWGDLTCSLCAWAIWRMPRRLAPLHAPACFFVASCLCITLAMNNLRSGQANLILGAFSMHVATDLAERHWWRSAATLALGLALKPLMLVLLLMVWTVYRPMTWRVPLAITAVFGAPFCSRDGAWLTRQYADCWTKLGMSDAPTRLFEDIRGLLASLRWSTGHESYLIIRAFCAVVVLAIACRARARLSEPFASFIAALAVTYVVLLNARTRATSYTMLAACAGLLTALFAIRGRYQDAIVLVVVVVSWNLSGPWFSGQRHWLKPLTGIVFLWVLTREVLSASAGRPSTPDTMPASIFEVRSRPPGLKACG